MQVTERVELTGGVLELEVGKLAKQADGACLVRFGESFYFDFADAPARAIEFDNLHDDSLPYFRLRTQPGYIFLSLATLGSETLTMYG